MYVRKLRLRRELYRVSSPFWAQKCQLAILWNLDSRTKIVSSKCTSNVQTAEISLNSRYSVNFMSYTSDLERSAFVFMNAVRPVLRDVTWLYIQIKRLACRLQSNVYHDFVINRLVSSSGMGVCLGLRKVFEFTAAAMQIECFFCTFAVFVESDATTIILECCFCILMWLSVIILQFETTVDQANQWRLLQQDVRGRSFWKVPDRKE